MSGRGSPGMGSVGAGIVLYGTGPSDPFVPRIDPLTPGVYPAPMPAAVPGTTISLEPYAAPTGPESLEAIIQRTSHRIAWLKNELRMHAAWQRELETLEAMLVTWTARKSDEGSEDPK